MKAQRPSEAPGLAAFVRDSLAGLGERQADFVRRTGFDQAHLSKIVSGLMTSLNLETALRLAVGLGVAPRDLLSLIGRSDLDELVARAYPPLAGIEEGERQIILLALFKLKRERPGWDYAIGEIEAKLGGQLDFPEESAAYRCVGCREAGHIIADCPQPKG